MPFQWLSTRVNISKNLPNNSNRREIVFRIVQNKKSRKENLCETTKGRLQFRQVQACMRVARAKGEASM